jgi:hypothetical protein
MAEANPFVTSHGSPIDIAHPLQPKRPVLFYVATQAVVILPSDSLDASRSRLQLQWVDR